MKNYKKNCDLKYIFCLSPQHGGNLVAKTITQTKSQVVRSWILNEDVNNEVHSLQVGLEMALEKPHLSINFMKHRIDNLLIESSKKFSANCRKPWCQFADINIAMNFPMISLFVQISGTYGWTNQMPWMRRQEKKKRTVWDIKGKKNIYISDWLFTVLNIIIIY